jgi:hypothetical protein
LVIGLAVAGCGERTPTESADRQDDRPSPFIVSNASSSLATVGASTPAVADGSSLVFISLPPGRIPEGIRAAIRNLASGEVVQTDVREGGFDPVALHAVAGDQILIEVAMAGNGEPVRATEVVSLRRRPVVVRTDPPPRKRDVPLNKIISVVFSEPINASALTDGAIRLRSGNSAIPALLAFADQAQIVVNLTASEPLAPGTEYELVIGPSVRDISGDSLEETPIVPFTTVAGVATRLAFDALPLAAVSGVPLSVIRVTAVDDAGRPVIGFQRPVSLSLSANPAGAALIGPPSSVPTGGVASFMSLTVTHAGRFTLVASAEGLPQAISASFDVASGGRIAFVGGNWLGSVGGEPAHIYVVNLDGGAVTQLTSGPVFDDWPAWSPDGSRIAFARGGDTATAGIYIMNADGSGLQRVSAIGGTPAWSPDGTRIAFSGGGLHVMNADGSGVVRLSDTGGDYAPAWSPDGSTIAYNRFLDVNGDGWTQVYLMNADGSGQRRLTNDCTYTCGFQSAEGHPSWSPDGRTLTYWSYFMGVTVIAPDGTSAHSITTPGQIFPTPFFPEPVVWFESNPDWAPDGRAIVFWSNDRLYTARVDGIGGWALLSLPTGAHAPAWQRAR